MLFSIIIPTYNRAHLIENTIRSVLNQTYTNFELIIVDDGSTDNTESVVKSIDDERIKYYKKENAERGAARNYGIDKSKGDYITFLDSDDVFYSNALASAFEAIKKDCPGFFHLSYEILYEEDSIIQSYNTNNPMFLVKGNPLSCIGIFIKSDIFNAHKFNEDRLLSGSEDWELWMRLYANYGLISYKDICGAIIQHDQRSVMSYSEEELCYRKNKAIEYAFKDDKVRSVFSRYMLKINAYLNSYIALHLILSKNKKRALHYYLEALKLYPILFFSRRSLAIIKHLIFS
jgi:glycosyltransferase involved in cell wall biosynthesis